MSRQDRADRRLAASVIAEIGHLQHAQDHRLKSYDQQKLRAAKDVLHELMNRIQHQVEL